MILQWTRFNALSANRDSVTWEVTGFFLGTIGKDPVVTGIILRKNMELGRYGTWILLDL